jgi:hypothetical protein
VVSLLQIAPMPTDQVLLHVRFAEVSRSALTEVGASLFTSATGIHNTIGRVTTQQFPVGVVRLDAVDEGQRRLRLGCDVGLGQAHVQRLPEPVRAQREVRPGHPDPALQSRGLFQSLAEPNLVAESGKEASFLAGGEFPIPIAQGSGANIGVSVMFKEYGVRLGFTPVINGDRVHLKVRPEVSTLDFANAVQLAGFRIPALTTRRTETEIELRDRQTFAIAGLLNNNMTSTMQKIPGIGDIPVLGLLFRSKAAQKNRTELVVMITPEILRAGSVGVTGTAAAPGRAVPAWLQQNRSIAPPPPAFPTARERDPVSKPRSLPIVGEEAMLKRLRNLCFDERGMSFAFVGIGLMTFMAATTLAVDVGMFMTARTQAQTSADAGALAGATALVFNNWTIAPHPDRRSECDERLTAEHVMGGVVSVQPSDVTFRTIVGQPTASRSMCTAPPGAATPSRRCLDRCSAFDNRHRGHGDRRGVTAGGMTCVKPFIIPDKWTEITNPPWNYEHQHVPALRQPRERTRNARHYDPHGRVHAARQGHAAHPSCRLGKQH